MAAHSTVSLGARHPIHNWEYADQTAREAATGLTSADIGKVALQQDDGSFWGLTDDSPLTWVAVSGGGGSVPGWLVGNQDPSGFDRGFDSKGAASIGDISFVNGTRTFTIQPQGGESDFRFYVQGSEIVKTTAQNVVIDNTEGLHHIYFDDNGDIQTTMTFSEDLVTRYAYVCGIRWDATNGQEIHMADERHGYRWPGLVHLWAHRGLGTLFNEGLDLGDMITDGSGALNTHAQFSYASGSIADEDIAKDITGASAPANVPVYYRTGVNGDWRLKTADNFPFIYSGTAGYTGASGRIAYNQDTGATWQLTEVPQGDLIIMLYFATTDDSRQVVGIQGQNLYDNIFDARTGILSELSVLVKDGLPFQEFAECWGVIVQSSTAYSNTPAARFRTLDDGNDYLDLRNPRGFGTGNATGATGDVSGPSSATDNAVARFDGTTGKLLQTSVVVISDTGDVSGVRTTQYNALDPATVAHSEGLVFYDNVNKALVCYNEVAGITHQLGQELFLRVRNVSGSTIPNGSAVYVNGSDSQLPTIALAQANSYATAYAAGLTTHAIANNSNGYVTLIGQVNGLDTSGLSVGPVYVSATTPGALTSTQPSGGNIVVRLGSVGNVHATQGAVFVRAASIPLQADKSLLVPGDINISADGSTLANPRVVGVVDMTAGEGARYQFGDANNGWQNGYDQAMQLWAYHSIIFIGDKNSAGAPTMETTSNIGVIFRNSTASSPAVAIDAAASQSTDLLQFRTSTGTLLCAVDENGSYNANNHDIDAIKTATFYQWGAVTAAGSAATVNYQDYQKCTVSLNNLSSVTVTLNEPDGPGNFMLILQQGSTTPSTITWATQGTHALYAPNGTLTVASTTNSITMIGLAYDGTSWYAVSSQPMQTVIAS